MTDVGETYAWLPAVREDLKQLYGLTDITVAWVGGHYVEVESGSGARILLEPRVLRTGDMPTVPRPFALDHNAATDLLNSEEFYANWVDSPDEWPSVLADDTSRQLDRVVGEVFHRDGILLVDSAHQGLSACLYPLDDADAFSALVTVKSRKWPLGFQIAGLTIDATSLVPQSYVGASGVVVALQRFIEIANALASPHVLKALATLEVADA